jgi:hypothetical protein
MFSRTKLTTLKTRSVSKIITIQNLCALLAFYLLCYISSANVYADTHTAASCSLADVTSAINAASAGDIVSVPAGNCTWSSGITIKKGISLLGQGIGVTTIKSSSGHITYQTPLTAAANIPFRISGFTFDLNGGSAVSINIQPFYGRSAPYIPADFAFPTKIRIDHCRITGGAACSTSAHAINVSFAATGVADNNIIDGFYLPIMHDGGVSGSGSKYGGKQSWDMFHIDWVKSLNQEGAFVYDNFYYEDNTITFGQSGCSEAGVSHSQFSGRYSFRYNIIAGIGAGQPIIDAHGNDGRDVDGAMYSSFGGELYGNQVTAGGTWLDHRGGKFLSFYNNFTSTPTIQVTEEHPDSELPETPEPQHVHDSYYWKNLKNLKGTVISTVIVNDTADPGIPAQNKDFWTDDTSEGPSGVFCGSLANMPATCTTGQGYWATEQSCTDLTGMVGVNPTTPISGTLYKCTATNTWTEYYTPPPYPHPLRKPEPPMNVMIK